MFIVPSICPLWNCLRGDRSTVVRYNSFSTHTGMWGTTWDKAHSFSELRIGFAWCFKDLTGYSHESRSVSCQQRSVFGPTYIKLRCVQTHNILTDQSPFVPEFWCWKKSLMAKKRVLRPTILWQLYLITSSNLTGKPIDLHFEDDGTIYLSNVFNVEYQGNLLTNLITS